MATETMFISSRINSFKFALKGIYFILRTQPNFKIQLLLALLSIILGFSLHISSIEWSVIILLIGLVLSAEVINTSVEILCDKIEQDYHESIRRVKDIAAASVLIASICAFIIGIIIFLPKIVDHLALK